MGDGHRVRTVPVSDLAELRSAVRSLARPEGGPVIVLVGGASGLAGPAVEAVARLFREHLVPALDRWGGLVVDGGTDAGVMQLIGRARAAQDAAFILVGVAAAGTVSHAGQEDPSVDTELEPNHSMVLLVPGDSWGDEAPWIAAVPTELAPGRPSATLLVNGGSIAFDDADLSVAAGRPVVVVAGSGRTSDEIAAAVAGRAATQRAVALAASSLVRVAELADPASVVRALADALNRAE
jgi:TRPM family ion channel